MEKKLVEVVTEAQNGSEEAFIILYQRYNKQAFHYALKLTHNEADAKDAVQEAFSTIHKEIVNLRNPEYFSAWMSRIVFSKCTKIFRANKDVFLDDEKLKGLPNQNVVYKDYLPVAKLHEKTDIAIVHQLMHKLSDKLQEVLDLIYFKNYSIKETSVLLNIPQGTIKSRMNQGRILLKKEVEAYELKEQRKIDFKLDTPIAIGGLAIVSRFKNFGSLSSGVALKSAVILAISTVSVVTATKMYELSQQPKSETVNNKAFVEITHLDPIIYREKEITSYKSAYYTLMDWAANKNEMSEKSPEEIAEIRKVVELLSSSNSVYRTMFESKEWFTYFENL